MNEWNWNEEDMGRIEVILRGVRIYKSKFYMAHTSAKTTEQQELASSDNLCTRLEKVLFKSLSSRFYWIKESAQYHIKSY